jgi:glycosyltransferase involved in cell wall biosynthesis
LGQGAALQTGIDYALAHGAGFVCTFDADGQHSPQAITDLLEGLDRSGAEIALGSRFLEMGASVPPLRRTLLRAALLFTRLHARVDVTDTHNGLRALTRRAAEAIRIEQPQMAHASEILQKIGIQKLAFVEVPVQIDYTGYSRKKGQSGFDSVKILLDLLYRSIAVRH